MVEQNLYFYFSSALLANNLQNSKPLIHLMPASSAIVIASSLNLSAKVMTHPFEGVYSFLLSIILISCLTACSSVTPLCFLT